MAGQPFLLFVRFWLLVLASLWVVAAPAATLPKGKERLRELAVVPMLKLSFNFDFKAENRVEDLMEEGSVEERIDQVQKNLRTTPDNPEWHLQLGKLLRENNDTNASQACFTKAIALGRKAVESRPNDGQGLRVLAEALDEMNNYEEAETIFRRATVVASNDWRCWVGLGRYLDQRSDAALLYNWPTNSSVLQTFFRDENAAKYAPPAEKMEDAIRFRSEAASCFRQAVAEATNTADVYLMRAFHSYKSNFMASFIQRFRGKETLSEEQFSKGAMVFPEAAMVDLQRVSELNPRAYKPLCWIVWTEWSRAMIEADGDPAYKPVALNQLPERSRRIILSAMQRLSAIGEGADKKAAASALTSLCVLKTMLYDEKGLTTDVQRAVELDPGNEQAWNMLIGISAHEDSPEKFTELCERRLRFKKTAQNHLIVAKAMFRQKRYKEAEQHAKAACKLDKNYAPAPLMLAALAIRQDYPSVALAFLLLTTEAIDQLKDADEVDERKREAGLNMAIVCALKDEPAKARELLEGLLKRDKDDESAREILNALP